MDLLIKIGHTIAFHTNGFMFFHIGYTRYILLQHIIGHYRYIWCCKAAVNRILMFYLYYGQVIRPAIYKANRILQLES